MNEKPRKGPAPMDVSIREAGEGVPVKNTPRICYALKTLVAEIHEMFPETPVEYSGYDGRNTALSATLDLSMLDDDECEDLTTLLTLFDCGADPRIEEVVIEKDDPQVLISMKSSATLQDSREPFGLSDAWSVMVEDGSL